MVDRTRNMPGAKMVSLGACVLAVLVGHSFGYTIIQRQANNYENHHQENPLPSNDSPSVRAFNWPELRPHHSSDESSQLLNLFYLTQVIAAYRNPSNPDSKLDQFIRQLLDQDFLNYLHELLRDIDGFEELAGVGHGQRTEADSLRKEYFVNDQRQLIPAIHGTLSAIHLGNWVDEDFRAWLNNLRDEASRLTVDVVHEEHDLIRAVEGKVVNVEKPWTIAGVLDAIFGKQGDVPFDEKYDVITEDGNEHLDSGEELWVVIDDSSNEESDLTWSHGKGERPMLPSESVDSEENSSGIYTDSREAVVNYALPVESPPKVSTVTEKLSHNYYTVVQETTNVLSPLVIDVPNVNKQYTTANELTGSVHVEPVVNVADLNHSNEQRVSESEESFNFEFTEDGQQAPEIGTPNVSSNEDKTHTIDKIVATWNDRYTYNSTDYPMFVKKPVKSDGLKQHAESTVPEVTEGTWYQNIAHRPVENVINEDEHRKLIPPEKDDSDALPVKTTESEDLKSMKSIYENSLANAAEQHQFWSKHGIQQSTTEVSKHVEESVGASHTNSPISTIEIGNKHGFSDFTESEDTLGNIVLDLTHVINQPDTMFESLQFPHPIVDLTAPHENSHEFEGTNNIAQQLPEQLPLPEEEEDGGKSKDPPPYEFMSEHLYTGTMGHGGNAFPDHYNQPNVVFESDKLPKPIDVSQPADLIEPPEDGFGTSSTNNVLPLPLEKDMVFSPTVHQKTELAADLVVPATDGTGLEMSEIITGNKPKLIAESSLAAGSENNKEIHHKLSVPTHEHEVQPLIGNIEQQVENSITDIHQHSVTEGDADSVPLWMHNSSVEDDATDSEHDNEAPGVLMAPSEAEIHKPHSEPAKSPSYEENYTSDIVDANPDELLHIKHDMSIVLALIDQQTEFRLRNRISSQDLDDYVEQLSHTDLLRLIDGGRVNRTAVLESLQKLVSRKHFADGYRIVQVLELLKQDSINHQSTISAPVNLQDPEMMSLIPHIIEQLRLGHVSETEKLTLAEIFGDLWPLMVVEAMQGDNQDRVNTQMREILDSQSS
ncbi:uncharacterized protein LOC131691548 isoform X2 [Topomyia yanbarensis]|uniref:uncharacterized protein LOC131691548 isoform X2 n=1 Tax=Topomyia yanbarensis TaxID=2498891 RepID=UPI00273A8F16|nr:uncharacterized protein LOC131691548 isoform X2 [Topomyia yanbarensis]